MAHAYLQSGQRFESKGAVYELDCLLDNEWQYINVKTKKSEQISVDDLYKNYANGNIAFLVRKSEFIPEVIRTSGGDLIAAHLDMFEEYQQELMKIRRVFLEYIIKKYGDTRSQTILKPAIKELWNNQWGKVPGASTVARWMKRYIESGKDIRSLNSGNHRKGNNKNRYPLDITDMCLDAIGKVYLDLTRGSIKKTYAYAVSLIKKENNLRPKNSQFPIPQCSYISGLIKRIPEYDKFLKRFGVNAARHKFRNAIHGIFCERPLERVEIDHTQLDLHAFDRILGMTIGRPWLTLVIDVYTRAILGFSLSFDPPSHMTVARALKMALLPKVNLQTRWPSIKKTWPMFGCMEDIVVDNGLEFHGNSFEAACYELGINIGFCPRKAPWWKGHVERAIGTLNRAVTDGMPGRAFSSIAERADYDAVGNAALSLETLEEMIAKWIVDIYHETKHSTMGDLPRAKWEDSIRVEDIPLVPNANELDAVIGIVSTNKHSNNGIKLNILNYNNDELLQIRLEKINLDKKVTIKWNPMDMGHIHYYAHNGKIIKVPVIPSQTEYADGLTYYRHQAYKAYAKKYLEGREDIEALLIAKREYQELAEKDIKKNSKKTRVQHFRFLETDKQKPNDVNMAKEASKTITPIVMSDTPRPKFAATISSRNQNGGY